MSTKRNGTHNGAAVVRALVSAPKGESISEHNLSAQYDLAELERLLPGFISRQERLRNFAAEVRSIGPYFVSRDTLPEACQ